MSGYRVTLFAVLLTGCGEQYFRAETVWHADGRVDRAIFAPAEFVPAESRTGWSDVRITHAVTNEAFTGPIRDRPAKPDSNPPYIAAWGTFLSPDSLPNHLRFAVSDQSLAAGLERAAAVHRDGLVIEYVWSETLTDVVSLADMQAARRDLAELVAGLVEATLRDGNQAYDMTELVRWLRGDAADWIAESHAVIVEAALRRELQTDAGDHAAQRLAEVAAKHGLVLNDDGGELLAGIQLDAAISRLLITKLRATVRTADGDPIDDATARSLLRKLGIVAENDTLTFEESEPLIRAIESRFGSLDATRQAFENLQARLFGVHMSFLRPPRPFHFEMSVPGAVVETTGQVLGRGRVVWIFDASDAFPLGYEMRVRSLVPNDAAQQAVLGEVRLKTLEQLAEYMRLVNTDSGLAAAMKRAVQTASLKPLYDYEADLQKQSGVEPAVRARATALRRLLTK